MRWLALSVLVLGCSAPTLKEGFYECTVASECPSGWFCRVDRYCYSADDSADSGDHGDGAVDAATDSGSHGDSGADSGSDAGTGGLDAGTDASVDAGFDAGSEGGVDAGADANSDAGHGSDAEVEAGTDAAEQLDGATGEDAGSDACVPGSGGGEIRQPNGTLVPQGNNLLNALNAVAETISPLTDATLTPETFAACNLQVTVVTRGSGQRNSFGWYNVTGAKPTLDQLYEIVGCTGGVGSVSTADVASDPRYLGGAIGLYMATPEGHTNSGSFCTTGCGPNCVDLSDPSGTLGYVYFTEPRFNPDANNTPSVHLLVLASRLSCGDYYLAWEDRLSGSDNDFEDLLVRVGCL